MAELLDVGVPGGGTGRVVRRGVGFGGSIGAVVLFCLSLTPSLLPRHWALQGALSGLSMAIGYAVGATIGAVARTIWSRPRLPWWAWRVLAATGGVLAVVFLLRAEAWQRDVRQLVGVAPQPVWGMATIIPIAAGVFALFLTVARVVRLGTRRLAIAFARFSPRPVASVAAVGAVAALTYGLGQSVVPAGFADVADRIAEKTNGITVPQVARPDSPYVSGGPGSLMSWDSLGAHGREFTAGVSSVRELAGFSGGEAQPPIRAYVGLDSAGTVEEQADLAVRELARTGGFDRAVLAVIITTGTGWVNQAVPMALEYLLAGDTAVVATQYSYAPSLISFMADRESAADAAATLIGTLREQLATLPADQRPELVVYGESLGTYGIEAAFGGLEELMAGIDGALLAGPPQTSPIWERVTAERDAGSPIWLPTYRGGATVQFAQGEGDLPAGADRPQVVYLQNATDPVVWWNPELLYREPEWLDGARSPDVSGAMRWLPLITFWQVSMDGAAATSDLSPPGHGHSYRESFADAWAALVGPPDWTDSDTARLRAQLSTID